MIGGGPVGAFSAYHLKKAGKAVTWLTGGQASLSAAWASAGLVGVGLSTPLPQYEGLSSNIKWLLKKDSPVKLGLGFMLKNLGWFSKYSRNRQVIMSEVGIKTQTNLSLRSLAILRELIDAKDIEVDFSQDGILQLFTTKHVIDGQVKQLNRLVGGIVRFEVVDSETCLEMEPLLSRDDAMGIFFPEEGAMNSQKFLESIRKLDVSMGVNVIERKAEAFQTDGSSITGITTEDGDRITSGAYLMAAGANNPLVAKSLGLRVPVVPAWGHSELMTPKDKMLKRPVEIAEGGTFISNVSNTIKLTSFFEFKGMEYRVPEDRFEYMERAASEFFPFISGLKAVQRVSGMRPCVPDSLPVVGKSSKYGNLFWATGNCRQGVMQSAETGRLVSEAILGKDLPEEYGVLTPARFGI